MKKVGVRVLKSWLKEKDQDELVTEICDLFKRLDQVKEYYTGVFSQGDDTAVIAKYRKIIKNEFFPARGYGNARLSVARKAVSDYKKVAGSVESIADLMLYYVENGVRFTNAYGDIDEPFYNSMESMYEGALKHIVRFHLADRFRDRCQAIAGTAPEGWGFQEYLDHART